MRRWCSTLVLSLAAAAGPLAAQSQDRDTVGGPATAAPAPAALPALATLAPVGAPPAPRPAAIRWWHGALLMGGVSALAFLDEPLRQVIQDHRSATLDHTADVVRPFGEAGVYLGLTGGLLAVGAVSHHPKLTNAGSRLATTLLLASVSVEGAKLAVGRPRPGEPRLDSDDLAPFSGRNSMPSGHTTLAFAFATELADDIHRPWATVGLYTLATAVGWSRLNDDRHWLSDVGAGAALGIITAKLADDRWRIFNLQPPHIGFGSHHLTVGWQRPF